MSAVRYDSIFYPPSNSRRCAKEQLSYTEQSDTTFVSESVNHDFNSNDSYDQNEYSALDTMQPEDAEKEPITIDKSQVLYENPLLAQSTYESCSEDNVASSQSSSQFHITCCEAKLSEVHTVSGVDEACVSDVINSTVVSSKTDDNLEMYNFALQTEKRVLDAMQNAVGQYTKKIKSKPMKKEPYKSKPHLPVLGSSYKCGELYNYFLNDLGESYFEEEKSGSALSTDLTTSEAPIKPKIVDEYINEYSKCKSKKNNSGFNDLEESDFQEEKSPSLSECNMEIVKTNKKYPVEEDLPVFYHKDLMVNFSEASVSQYANIVINFHVSNTMYDESLNESPNGKFSELNTSLDDSIMSGFHDSTEADFQEKKSDSVLSTVLKTPEASIKPKVIVKYVDEYSKCKTKNNSSRFNDLIETDFQEEKSDSILSTVLKTSEACVKPEEVVDYITEYSKCKSKNNNKRKICAEDSSQTSDNLLASEYEDDKDSGNVLKEKLSLNRKKLFTSSRGVLEAVSSETASESAKKECLKVFAHKDLMLNSSEASVSHDVSYVINSDVTNTMFDESLNESLNDKSSALNTSLDKRDESESMKNDDGEKCGIVPENDNPFKNAKVGEMHDENMVIETTDVIMSESFVESSSEMSKGVALESETALSYLNAQPETNILTPETNNEHDMNLRESILLTKAIDSKTISKIDIDDTSEQNCNIESSSRIIICDSSLDRVEDVSKQEDEIIKVKMDNSENISQVNNISLLENVSGPETVSEKYESTFEVPKHNNEEMGLKSDPEKVKGIENIDSDKNQNISKVDLCMSSDDKSENVQLPYSETFDSDLNVISPKKIILHNNDESGTAEPKKCPEIKILIIKNSGDSPDSLRNWFVSDTKQTHEVIHSVSDIKVPKTPVDSVGSIIDVNQETVLNADADSAPYLERNFDAIASDPSVSVDTPVCDTNISLIDVESVTDHKLTSVKTTTVIKDESQLTDTNKTLTKLMHSDSSLFDHLSHNDDIFYKHLVDEKITSTFFDDNPLIDLSDSYYEDLPTEKTDSSFFEILFVINDISDKDMCIKKGNISFPEDNPLAEIDKMLSKHISSKNIHTSLSGDDSLLDKIPTKDTNAKILLDTVSPVSIKEEPLDEEEGIEINSSLNNVSSHIKSENSHDVYEVKKKKQWRPHTVNASKISSSNVMLSTVLNNGLSIHETPKPKGQKKKTIPSAASTPLTGRKKKYDAELVCVPFSMGWMRQHVIRATGKDDNNKRQSDIYYFAPDGTKLRSKVAIETYLSKHPDIKLTLKNFTFAKKLIYHEPFEIERDARQMIKKVVKKVVSERKHSLSEDQKFAADNEKLFGKYPVIKCVKLDIENLVKNNKIKVSDWLLHDTESPKNNK